MPAPELQPISLPLATTFRGTRIVASASTLDGVTWPAGTTLLRFAPDEMFVIDGDPASVNDLIDDADAIVVAEAGYVGCNLDADQLAKVVDHLEWPLPTERPALAQGFIAGVPAKLLLTRLPDVGDQALLLTNAAYARELWERLE